jgi:hypothetical protein
MTPIVRARRRSGRFRLDAAVRYVRCARGGLPTEGGGRVERTSEALWSVPTARYWGDPGRHARGDGARRGGRQAPYTCHHPRRTAQGRLHDRPRASGWVGKIIGYDKGRDAIARKSNAIGNCLSSEQGEPGAVPRGDISPTPEVEPLNIPLEPSQFGLYRR